MEEITLNVGYGTFATVDYSKDLAQHKMPLETYRLPHSTAGRLDADWADPSRKILAVGTTVTRTLESCAIRGLSTPRVVVTGLNVFVATQM